MSKTAESVIMMREAEIAYSNSKVIGECFLQKDFKVGFASGYMIASSSKDARIKELEVQISGKTFFDEKETMAAKIQELEARLETAESGLEKAINFIDNEADKAMRNGSCRDVVDYYDNFKSELKAFLTNKTE